MSHRLESQRRIDTEYALRCVTLAYDRLKACGAIHAAARVRTCLKSVEGAVRHARRLEHTDYPPKFQVTVHRRPKPPTGVRQTSCRHCGLDIEAFAPYRAGTWRDRGNETHCHTAPHVGKAHAPYREGR